MKEHTREPGRTASEFDPQAARERCEAATEGAGCRFCTIEIDGDGSAGHEPNCISVLVPQLVEELEGAQEKLGAIQEAAALAPSLPASTILDILGESK